MKRKWPRCQNRISFSLKKGFFMRKCICCPFCPRSCRCFQYKYSNISFIFYLIICNVMYAIKGNIWFLLPFYYIATSSETCSHIYIYIKTRKIYIRPPPFIQIGRTFFHMNALNKRPFWSQLLQWKRFLFYHFENNSNKSVTAWYSSNILQMFLINVELKQT